MTYPDCYYFLNADEIECLTRLALIDKFKTRGLPQEDKRMADLLTTMNALLVSYGLEKMLLAMQTLLPEGTEGGSGDVIFWRRLRRKHAEAVETYLARYEDVCWVCDRRHAPFCPDTNT